MRSASPASRRETGRDVVALGQLGSSARAATGGRRRRGLQDAAAGAVRALAAHGRDHGGPVDEWRKTVTTTAAATAAFLDRDPEPVRGQLSGTLERGASCIADALVALPRDPSTVPDHLAEAAAEFLVVFAAMAE